MKRTEAHRLRRRNARHRRAERDRQRWRLQWREAMRQAEINDPLRGELMKLRELEASLVADDELCN